MQVGVLAVAFLAQSAEGACYAIMASTPDDNFHYQAIMQTLGTCPPSSVKWAFRSLSQTNSIFLSQMRT